jgi:hypothetical protein
VEFLFVLAALVPFALGGWIIGIVAYARARAADRRAAALERRVAQLEGGEDPRGRS